MRETRLHPRTNFQRAGAISNTHAGREFEQVVRPFLGETGISLQPCFAVPIGGRLKKAHKFDLGSEKPPVLVECKSFTWTAGGNSPSAKIRAMNEVMLHFSLAPARYRKMLFILHHMRKDVSLGVHYVKTQGHLIPDGVEIWEFDMESKRGSRLH